MERTAWNKGITKYKPKLCICGCGELVKLHKYSKNSGGFTYSTNRFIKGHEKRGISGFDLKIHISQLCACGCGQYTKKFRGKYNKFIKKHENIGRTAWNKSRPFSLESRKKMSIARLGKEPINRIFGDYWHLQPRTLQKDAWKRKFLKNLGYQIEEIWEHDIKDKGVGPVLNEFVEKYNL